MTESTNSSIDVIARTCIAARMRLLNRVVTNFYDDALRPFGLKISQVNILIATGKLGEARPGQVCEILQLDTSTLSRNVERMRTNGWIEIVPDEQDARMQTFRLTAQGRRLIELCRAGVGGRSATGRRSARGGRDCPPRKGGEEARGSKA